MVLQVLAYAWQGVYRVDAVRLKLGLGAYAGEHEQLWRAKRTGAQNDFSRCGDLHGLTLVQVLHARGAFAIHQYALSVGTCHDFEVGTVQMWGDKGLRSAATLTARLHRLCRAASELLLAVVVGGAR